jgi:protocatechuate 3,4-dioxygenase beta subunit
VPAPADAPPDDTFASNPALRILNHRRNPVARQASGPAKELRWRSRDAALLPTPDCDDDGATPAQTQGPFYAPDTPRRTMLREAGITGTPLTIEGRVLTTDCRPVGGAVLDVWSCDGAGVYDNDGFRLRGHQFTDAAGRFRIDTLKPSDYRQFGIRRTPHIHVKLQGRETLLLTTQLYFPDEPLNAQDGIFNAALEMAVEPTAGGGLQARFDFVLAPR